MADMKEGKLPSPKAAPIGVGQADHGAGLGMAVRSVSSQCKKTGSWPNGGEWPRSKPDMGTPDGKRK